MLADLSAFTADIEFDVVDNAAGLIAEKWNRPAVSNRGTQSLLMVRWNIRNASDGALSILHTDVDFDVADTAQNIANEVNNNGLGSLNEAGEVIVETGSAVNAADAAAIQVYQDIRVLAI